MDTSAETKESFSTVNPITNSSSSPATITSDGNNKPSDHDDNSNVMHDPNNKECKCMQCKMKQDLLGQYKFFQGRVLEFKELDDGDLVIKGIIATTHIDSGGDMIRRETLERWAKEINDANPRTNKTSYRHNRKESAEKGVAGKMVPGSAKVIKLPDGQYGLYAEHLINKSRPDFDKIQYELQKEFIDSFSIEYRTQFDDGTPIPGAATYQEIDGKQVRILHPATELYGDTLASQPMNEYAVMMKEYYSGQKLEEKKLMEQKEMDAKVAEISAKEKILADKEAALAAKEVELSKKTEAPKVEEKKEVDVSTILQSKEFEAKVDSLIQKKGMLNMVDEKTAAAPQISVAQKEYSAVFERKEHVSVTEQFQRAGRLAAEMNLFRKETSAAESREYKNFGTNGSNLQYKDLAIGSNQNSSYVNATSGIGISQAELQDVFDPVIYNALNEQTALFNVLAKDNFAGRGTNNVMFVLKIGRNPSAGAYLGNDVNLDKTSRSKYLTRFKKYQAGWAVDGDLLAASRGSPIGDLVAREIEDATLALKTSINIDLFTAQGLETSAQVIGMRYITQSATYTTLYGTTRSSTNKLAPATSTDTYIDCTVFGKNKLRQAIRYAVTDGSMKQDLLFVGNWDAVDAVKTLYDNAQRVLAPTATRFGFETDIFFEGIPVMGDKDAPLNTLFLVDTRAHRMAIFVPPTVETLGKRSDAIEGFVKTYFAIYNTAPRRLLELYNVPTPA